MFPRLWQRIRSSQRLRLQSLSILIATGVVFGIALWTPLLRHGENKAQDLLMAYTAKRVDPNLVLVAIDDTSVALSTTSIVEPEEIAASRALQLMEKGFPWSREVWGDVAQRLLDAGARVIIFDIRFAGEREGNAEFAEALRRNRGRIVIGSNFDDSTSVQGFAASYYISPAPELVEAAGPNGVGYVNLSRSLDSIVRWFYPFVTTSVMSGFGYQQGEEQIPALTTAAAELLGYPLQKPEVPTLHRFRYLKPHSIPSVPLHEIFTNLWDKTYAGGAFFKDKVVLIGATAALLQDYHNTPLGTMSGPEIQLNIFSALTHKAWIHTTAPGFFLLAIPLTGLVVWLFAIWRRNVAYFVWECVAVAFVWLLFFAAAYLFADWYVPVVHPLAALALCGFAALATDVSLERRERSRLRGTLERYVSKDVVHEIVENPTSYLQELGGQRKQIVALFCDLQGFTSEAEQLDASELVALLNEYFTQMVEVVFSHKGTLDKFMGDALMAAWGCVGSTDAHQNARSAVLAIFEMRRRLARLNAERETRGIKPWRSGAGLCLGPAVFGNIGSEEKMDPTIIGDTVNLTSRIESLTRIYGCPILIDERVAEHVADLCSLLLVDIVRVKGRRKPESLFFPIDDPAATEWIASFDAARAHYVARDFTRALAGFTLLAQSGPAASVAACYRKRCETFLQNPPPEDWQGVWVFSEK